MSNSRKNINKLISEKIAARKERVAEAGQDLEAVSNVLVDYRLYFNGAKEALKAAGIDDATMKAVNLAAENNEAEIALIEQRVNLENELNGDDE